MQAPEIAGEIPTYTTYEGNKVGTIENRTKTCTECGLVREQNGGLMTILQLYDQRGCNL